MTRLDMTYPIDGRDNRLGGSSECDRERDGETRDDNDSCDDGERLRATKKDC